MKKILFLDIDGVLNTHDWNAEAGSGSIHRDKMELVNEIIKTTGTKIVISTAWRYVIHRGEMNLAGFDWLLRSHGLMQNSLVGYTRLDTMIPANTEFNGNPKTWPMDNERGQQIVDWITINAPLAKYVAIDDLDAGITAAGVHLIKTESMIGLTPDLANLVIDALGVNY